jgi:phosphate transporter
VPEGSPVRHRYSISSSDDTHDLEANMTSRPRYASQTWSYGLPGSSSKSPIAAARALANRLSFAKDSSSDTDDIWSAKTNYAWDMRLLFKRRITNLFISLSSLKAYVEINYSGFRKVLKKYVNRHFSL